MHATPVFAAAARTPRAAGQAHLYSRVGVESVVHDASPHRLVAMLFEGYFEALARARAALAAGRTEVKAQEIARAVRIVDEGLKAGLDLAAGGTLAQDLADLYAYVTLRLTQANLKHDADALDECRRLVQPLAEAWQSIAPQADAARAR